MINLAALTIIKSDLVAIFRRNQATVWFWFVLSFWEFGSWTTRGDINFKYMLKFNLNSINKHQINNIFYGIFSDRPNYNITINIDYIQWSNFKIQK